MASEPVVSVLVPCYNKQAFVEETLASVFAQTFTDYELIVVDDGSTDASLTILRRYEAQGRLVLISQANLGASAARQRALDAARGRFIQYLDADDLLLPHALETRVRALKDSGGEVAYGDWQKLRSAADGVYRPDEVVSRRIEDVHADAELACFTSFWSPPAALLYARSVVERIGPWNPKLPVIQDARYLLDAALAGARFVHVPGVSAYYREDSEDSLSRRNRIAFARDVITNAEQVRSIWAARGTLTIERERAVAAAYEYAARESFRTDPAFSRYCVERLRALGRARPSSWPVIAWTLHRLIGRELTLRLLAVLGRSAP